MDEFSIVEFHICYVSNAGNPLHCLPVFQTLLSPSQFHHKSTTVESKHLVFNECYDFIGDLLSTCVG
jgi:hypothetical protein